MIDAITAIVALDPDAQVYIVGDDLVWHDGNPNGITTEQITAKQAELQTAYDAQQVAAAEAKSSAIGKLKALGLTSEEVREAFRL